MNMRAYKLIDIYNRNLCRNKSWEYNRDTYKNHGKNKKSNFKILLARDMCMASSTDVTTCPSSDAVTYLEIYIFLAPSGRSGQKTARVVVSVFFFFTLSQLIRSSTYLVQQNRLIFHRSSFATNWRKLFFKCKRASLLQGANVSRRSRLSKGSWQIFRRKYGKRKTFVYFRS